MRICQKHNEEMVLVGKAKPKYKCKSCNREYQNEWRKQNYDVQRERTARNNVKATKRNSDYIFEYLSEHPCVDCGEKDIVVLDFDHLSDKRAGISKMRRSYSLEVLIEEISKCEVVCANDHRRRTSERGDHWRSSL